MTRALATLTMASALFASAAALRVQEHRWWMEEPVRFLQTNLRELDSSTDPKALVRQVAQFQANTFLVNMGGIVAQYPTRVPFHYPSRSLPEGRDLFGAVLQEAHARSIRVVKRIGSHFLRRDPSFNGTRSTRTCMSDRRAPLRFSCSAVVVRLRIEGSSGC